MSGKPLAGVTVRGLSEWRGLTDEAGRFELRGVRKSGEYQVEVIPAAGQPYFAANLTLADTAGLDPIQTDVPLQTGTLCRGRLTDKVTGRPIAGEVSYYPLYPNANADRLPRTSNGPVSTTSIGADGQFVLPVLGGPGVLAFIARGYYESGYAAAFVSAQEIMELYQGKRDEGLFSEEFLTIAAGGQAARMISQAATWR